MNGIKLIIDKENDGLKIKSALRKSERVSSRLIRKVLHTSGALFLNGQEARFVDIAHVGDVIELVFPEEISDFEPQDIPLDVIFEDEDILLVNKKPDLVCHPTKGHSDMTLANGVMKHMLDGSESYKIRFINRLDMNTSGLVLIGKNAHAQTVFTAESKTGEVSKEYKALVKGRLEGEALIDLPITLECEGAVRRCVREGGYPSQTHYKAVRTYEIDGEVFTLLDIKLLTGRTHQIRVHLSHLGYPVLGDTLYGGESPLIDRQALHAFSLSFNHPKSGEPVRFWAELPKDMERLID
ncbi:MAG: RluA family pseudouridine synthase [Clostridiales Family XIII bacterium]|nr:RluA family pseudouridine synthase [Clostridiales Family XIII bacterium]